MSKVTCTRRVHFDAAHRVKDHESKCKMLHGHRYVVEVTFEAEKLDDLGRVIDFGSVYKLLGDWIDTYWDHNILLWDKDKSLGNAVAEETGQKVFYLPYNPTAENIALYLLEEVCPKLFEDDKAGCVAVRVNETPNCFADATL